MAEVVLQGLTKRFGETLAVNHAYLHVQDQELVVLVGPSGCGKTTALRLIAGLEEVTSGEIFIDDRLVNDVAPGDRDIAMVFQNYALYPHMTVRQNLAFGLKMRRTPKAEIEKRVK
ncbi:MAG: ABC transporter ATP-binding protein, partial [Planctomycetaceae bacterium]|nr:ABC transporter ATP-binding protein [Planctomycetaceae bacterium]